MPTVEEALFAYLRTSVAPGIDQNLDLRLDEDLNLDSLDVVEMTIYLEEVLNIPVGEDTDEIRKADTIGDLANLIRRKYRIQ